MSKQLKRRGFFGALLGLLVAVLVPFRKQKSVTSVYLDETMNYLCFNNRNRYLSEERSEHERN